MFTSQICDYILIIINSIYNVLLEICSFSVKSSLLYIVFVYFIKHTLFSNVVFLINTVSENTFIHITHLWRLLMINNTIHNKPCFSTTDGGIIYISIIFQLYLSNFIFQMDLRSLDTTNTIIQYNHFKALIHSKHNKQFN